MKIINNMVQGSDSWHKLRASRFTASEAAAACGDHKYMTRNDLLKQKATGIVPDVDAHQQRIFDQGHKFEEMARSIAEEIMQEELYPCTCEDDTETYLASMDGLDMLAERGWEHKSTNEKLRTATAETLEEHYKWQMDHQMMVTGAERILFMASNGTKEDCNWFWYERDEKRIERLIAAWEQFAKDLAEYQAPEAEEPKAEGKAPDALPALNIQARGEITASNLKEFEAQARKVIAGIKTDLVTDQDFADAEQTVKFCKKAEERLAAAKDAVLAQTVSLDEAFRTIDSVSEDLRQTRLKLDKAVKAQKESRKAEIVLNANKVLDAYIQSLRDEHDIVMPVINADFAGVIKGKKKLDAMQSAVDDELARAKIEANQAADLIRGNLAQINEHAADYKFLFNDFGQICMKPADDFAAIVKMRIAEHREAEQKRLDAERENIRQEEEAKAKREAEEKARAERIAEEKERREEQQAEAAMREQQSSETPTQDKKPAYKMPPLKYADPQPERMGDASQEDDKVLIDRAEYSQLLDDSAMLSALLSAGVDNWDGWDQAIEIKQEAA